MPPRPGHGTLGKKVLLYANYFKVSCPPELNLTRYNVEVQPEVTGKKLGRVIALLLALPEFAGEKIATEWKSFIVSPRPLNIPDGFTVQIPYIADGEDDPLPRAVTYTVRLVTPLSFSVSGLVSYLASVNPSPNFAQKAETIQVLNAVFGHHAQSHNGVVSIGQNRHYSIDRSQMNMHNIKTLGGGLEALRGFFQSVRTATGGLLLNVNVTHGVFLEPGPLSVLFPKLGTGNLVTLHKKMKLVRVKVTHLPVKKSKKTNAEIPRVKTIFGLAQPQDGRTLPNPPQVQMYGAGPKGVKFWLEERPPAEGTPPAKSKPPAKGKKPSGPPVSSGTYITVFDYFKKKYPQFQLNPNFPVVNVGNKENPSYLPAEVCFVLPGQTIKRRLSPDQTAQMILAACRKPNENGNSIIGDGRSVLGLKPAANSMASQLGLVVSQTFITVAGRVLAPPAITYRDLRSKEMNVVPRFGSWNMANIKFHTPAHIGEWTYIWFTSTRSRDRFGPDELRATMMRFQAQMNVAGMNASKFITERPPPVIQLVDGDESGNDAKIRDIFRRMHGAPKKPRTVFCILPFNDVAIYNSIKTVADTKAGIHTIGMVGQKLMKENRQEQYFGNVALKANLKNGGINQILAPAKMGIIAEGETMVVGIDVTHPSPGSKEGAPSAAGIVASIDKFLGQWPCSFDIQEGRKEMVSALEGMMISRLALWEKHNKKLPKNILIYRDGVSEGQYQLVLEQELPLIRKACRQKYPATATQQGFPKISIIVCGKRHHTRFYPTSEANADRSSNCEPGTVVDRGVTEVRNWDFFLQPHACLQGTARSCHYYVVLDEIFRGRAVKPPQKNAADALEELTHNMCHLFGRATKAVSLCPPAYYADLLCTRLRCYLSDQFDPHDTSATPSVASGATPQTTFDVAIPDNLKDTMFYI
ncbi:QDE2 protein [Acephala macrosclerotiorum]|nr:QDE2 protein [Acephala macrosclerotiorum]